MELSRMEIKVKAKEILRENFKNSVISVLIYVIISFIASFLARIIIFLVVKDLKDLSLLIISFLISMIIPSIMQAGLMVYFLEMAKGKEVPFELLFFGFKSEYFLKVLLLVIIENILVMVGGIFFIIPGLIWQALLFPIFYILYENPELSVIQIIERSIGLMKGKVLFFIVLLLSFIGWFLLVGITLGLAIFYVAPYVNLTLALLYLKISKGIGGNSIG